MNSPKRIRLGLAASLLLSAILSAGCLHDPVAERQESRREAFDLLTKGQQLKAQGDLILARDTFLEALQVSERPILYYEIGNCHYQLGNHEQALDYYDRALMMAPDYTLALSERALVQQKLDMELASSEPEPAQEVAVAEPQEPAVAEPEEVSAPTSPAEAPVEEEVMDEPVMETADPVAAPEEEMAEPMTEEEEAPAMESVQASETESPEEMADAEIQEMAPAEEEPATETAEAGEVQTVDQTGSGPFGGLTQAFQSLSGEEKPAPSGALQDIPEDQARRAIFPELVEETRLTPEGERKAARAASELGRFDEAVRRWTRVLGNDPEDVEARLALAEALYRSGRTLRANAEYLRAAALAPDVAEIHFQAANFYVRSGEPTRAKQAFDKALEIEPDHLRARNNLAALHVQMGNPELAINHLNQALEEDPLFASAWLNMALARDDAGYPASEVLEALENYRRLSESSDPQSENWLRDLRREVESTSLQQ